jgi:thiol-disulfide isomerase/thioredoxin
MPRIRILALAAVMIGAALTVLYVIRPIDASIPPQLSALVPDAAPRALPGAAFTDGFGRKRTLASFKGRFVILNLWATWCAPCVRELPALARLQAAVGRDRLSIVAVDEGRDNAADTAAFLKEHGAANLAAYRDPGLAMLTAFGAQGLPFSVLIDRQGREIARASGPMQWDDPAAVAYFKALAAHAE